MSKELTYHGNTIESHKWVVDTYSNAERYADNETVRYWVELNKKLLAEKLSAQKTQDIDTASKIYSLLYPKSNFHARSPEVQRNFMKAVKEIRKVLNDDPRN